MSHGIGTGTAPPNPDRHNGKMATRKPPALRAGVQLRVLPRLHGETGDDAKARAKLLTWWHRRINRLEPYADARNWIWHVRAA